MTVTTAPKPPRVRGTSKLPRRERELQVLDAATTAFGERGYAGVTVADIADRLGVSKALILAYFGSKDGVYAACAERAGGNLIDHIETAITAARPASVMAQATLAAIFTALEERPHDWNVLHDRTVERGTPGAQRAKELRTVIADQAARGVYAVVPAKAFLDSDDRSLLTEVWMSAVTAVVNWWLKHPDRSAAEMIDRCRRLIGALA